MDDLEELAIGDSRRPVVDPKENEEWWFCFDDRLLRFEVSPLELPFIASGNVITVGDFCLLYVGVGERSERLPAWRGGPRSIPDIADDGRYSDSATMDSP